MKITKRMKQHDHTSETQVQITAVIHPVICKSQFKDYITTTAKPAAHKKLLFMLFSVILSDKKKDLNNIKYTYTISYPVCLNPRFHFSHIKLVYHS
jgi:hypothetical protein